MKTPKELHSELESLLELDPGTITGQENLEDVGWDSLTIITFIALADSAHNLSLPASKVQAAKTVGDLLDLTTDPLHLKG